MDQVHDIYNMVHGCEIANRVERDIGIRRASGFNELYEAANKECALGAGSGSGGTQNQPSGSGSVKGKEKEQKGKQQFGPEVESLKELIRN